MLCFFCRRWRKSQSARLPGHVEEQGSSWINLLPGNQVVTLQQDAATAHTGSSLVQGQL